MDEQDRCYHQRYRIDPCVGCGRRYVAGVLVGPFLTRPKPWSATGCEVCEGSGVLTEETVAPCWYCKGAGWYEAAL